MKSKFQRDAQPSCNISLNLQSRLDQQRRIIGGRRVHGGAVRGVGDKNTNNAFLRKLFRHISSGSTFMSKQCKAMIEREAATQKDTKTLHYFIMLVQVSYLQTFKLWSFDCK